MARKERKKNRENDSGFAMTKTQPHLRHKAIYRRVRSRKKKKIVRYVTVTHSREVKLPCGKRVVTVELPDNIDPRERGKLNKKGKPSITYVYPAVYEAERSMLGKELTGLELTPKSRQVVDEVFRTAPVITIAKTSNSSKIKKPLK